MNEKEYKQLLKKVWLSGYGPCEKADVCPFASKQCHLTYNLGAFLPKKRYLLCFAWRHPDKMKRYMETSHL